MEAWVQIQGQTVTFLSNGSVVDAGLRILNGMNL